MSDASQISSHVNAGPVPPPLAADGSGSLVFALIHEVRQLNGSVRDLVDTFRNAKPALEAMVKMVDEVHTRLTELYTKASETHAAVASVEGHVLGVRAVIDRALNLREDVKGAATRARLLPRRRASDRKRRRR